MRLMILGHAQHGKDTFANILCDSAVSSSRVALEVFLRDALEKNHGLKYPDIEAAYEDRVNHRSAWFNAIAAYNADDPTRLMKQVFDRSPVYIGCRSHREFSIGRDEGVFDLSIWVTDHRKDLERASSMQLLSRDADIVVENNGTIADLEGKASRLRKCLFGS